MERGVEDRHLRHAGQRLARAPDRLERAAVLERRDDGEPLDLGLYVGVDQRRLLEAGSAVHDAVPDGIRRNELVDGLGFAVANEVELQAHRAGIDDENDHWVQFSRRSP